jgi:FtsZ-binding cell division protein ZapB
MTIRTAPPTIEGLQAEIAKLQQDNDSLVDDNLVLEEQLDVVREQLRDGEEEDSRRTDSVRRILVDHHDETGHRGSQRFCTEAPCPAFNALLEDGEL